MPYLDIDADFKPYYEIHDYTDPWTQPETIVFVHGFTENTTAYRAWIPHLARQYKLVMFDLRGFGKTAAVDENFRYSTELYVDDLVRVINALAGGGPVHLVAAKSGCISVISLAASRPDLCRSITLACPPLVAPGGKDWQPYMISDGMRAWARKTMPARLGYDTPPAVIDWWVDMMGATSLSTAKAYLKWVGTTESGKELPAVTCPTFIILADPKGSTNAAAGQVSTERVRELAPKAELMLMPYDCYHPSGSHPDECAQATLRFLQSLPK